MNVNSPKYPYFCLVERAIIFIVVFMTAKWINKIRILNPFFNIDLAFF